MIDKELRNMWEKLSLRDQERVAAFIEQLYCQEFEPIEDIGGSEFNIEDEPFVGMWADREDMADSTAYVRRLRGAT